MVVLGDRLGHRSLQATRPWGAREKRRWTPNGKLVTVNLLSFWWANSSGHGSVGFRHLTLFGRKRRCIDDGGYSGQDGVRRLCTVYKTKLRTIHKREKKREMQAAAHASRRHGTSYCFSLWMFTSGSRESARDT